MADPQLENGYTRIANELLDAICRLKISGNEFRILLFIIRRTYGFHRKSAEISLSEIAGAVGISPKKTSEIIIKLLQMDVICVEINPGNVPRTIQIQKDYSRWKGIPQKRYPLNEGYPNKGIPQMGDRGIPQIGDTGIPQMGDYTYKYKYKNNSKDSVCTHTRQKIKISEIIEIAEQLGYYWSEQEAQAFLDYNLDRGRKNGWEYAVKKWEENRKNRSSSRHGKRRELPEMTPQEIAEMNEYLSLANRFDEDEL